MLAQGVPVGVGGQVVVDQRHEGAAVVGLGEVQIDQGRGSVLVGVPGEPDLFERVEAAGDAVRAVGRSPVLALAAERPALAEESLRATGAISAAQTSSRGWDTTRLTSTGVPTASPTASLL
ncbi:hypothetical protein GCM10025862_19970 [Arsenicicoccus piscis]|uniref:Uncharacterized protein n=1 Tax=Arsenicicoccus piscis TaxID=673954 RepID=A0ABQ6HNE0_9MICO|nr:hypothetical protein GCM10025862_19970 [Arsenicicoccus piscis]